MTNGLLFSVLAAVSSGLWISMHKFASRHINNLLGSILISLTAVLLGALFLIPQMDKVRAQTTSRGLALVAVAGVFALGVDYFALRAYASNVPVSTVGPLVIGGGVAVTTIVGFFTGGPISGLRVLAIGFILAGATILARLE